MKPVECTNCGVHDLLYMDNGERVCAECIEEFKVKYPELYDE